MQNETKGPDELSAQIGKLTVGSLIRDYVGDAYEVLEVDSKKLSLKLRDVEATLKPFWVPMLELQRGFTITKLASISVKADDDAKPSKGDKPKKPKKTPEYKELAIRPREVSRDEVEQASTPSTAMIKAHDKLKASQNTLQELSRLLADLRAKFNDQVAKAEKEGNRLQEESKFKQAIDELALLISQSQNRVVNFGERIVALVKETKTTTPNADVQWKLDRLLDRYGIEAEKYLEAAARGLEAHTTTEDVEKLIEFELKPNSATPPRPEASLGKNHIPKIASDVAEFLGDAFNNVKHFLFETSIVMQSLDELFGEAVEAE